MRIPGQEIPRRRSHGNQLRPSKFVTVPLLAGGGNKARYAVPATGDHQLHHMPPGSRRRSRKGGRELFFHFGRTSGNPFFRLPDFGRVVGKMVRLLVSGGPFGGKKICVDPSNDKEGGGFLMSVRYIMECVM